MKTIKIGIDFGTSYSFCGYLRGDRVMPLIPSSENYGIPSIFYYDRGQILTGRSAERSAVRRPEYAVRSVKRKLKEHAFVLGGGRSFTPKEIVEEIIRGIVNGAETQLEQTYLEDYDEIEAVITVPVDFSEPMKNLIRDAASRVKIKNGKNLRVTRVIPEPIAASIEYFGIKKEQDADIIVFDLGGGTLDVALVRAKTDNSGIPYEVVDQQGNRALGGDDWDAKLEEWLEGVYRKETGGTVTSQIKGKLLMEARSIKEELTIHDKYIGEIEIRGDYIPVEITRTKFEELTAPLLLQVKETISQLMSRVGKRKIDHVIMTGGSSYMPQIEHLLENLVKDGTFAGKPDVQRVEPEHAIAYGAARYAATVVYTMPGESDDSPKKISEDDTEIITMRATHSYGIVYRDSKVGKDCVRFLIKKGDVLPKSDWTYSYTSYDGHYSSYYQVYESDYVGDETYVFDSSVWGESIMTIRLTRKDKNVPAGRKAKDTLTLTKDGILTIECVDQVTFEKADRVMNRNI